MITIGEILKKERLKKNISLLEVEKNTKIRKKFLEAIEENNWQIFPSKIYLEGLIKNYSIYLDLPYKKILAFFRRDYEGREDLGFKKKLSREYLVPETRKIITFIIIFLIILFSGYFGYQFKKFLSPPSIKFISPTTEYFTDEKKITLKAKVEKDTIVKIYNQRVYQDDNGIFVYEFVLKKGKNELLIELIGANGKKIIIKKNFYKK